MTLWVPSAEVHARYQASGLTCYSYDQVLAAVAVADQVRDEYLSLVDKVGMMLRPFDNGVDGYYGYPAAWNTLVKVFQTTMLRVPACYSLGLSHHSKEALPIKKLNADAATYRRATQQLRKALEAIR